MTRTTTLHPPRCACRGSGWVCEDHPTRPYATDTHVSCWCDAPGMRCPGPRATRPPLPVEAAREAVADAWRAAVADGRWGWILHGDSAAVRWYAGQILARLPVEDLDIVLARQDAIDVPLAHPARGAA